MSETVKQWIARCERAISERSVLLLHYRSLQATKSKKVEIQPYELISYDAFYYCIGYNRDAKAFRMYKFSEERMKECLLIDKKFTRDLDFNVKQYIGKSGLMKDEVFDVKFLVHGEKAIYVSEMIVGIQSEKTWLSDTTLQVHALMEGRYRIKSYLLSLGSSLELLSPTELKEELCSEVQMMFKQYQ